MINTKELRIGFVLLLVAASFSAVLMVNHKAKTTSSPMFVYDEMIVEKPIAKATPVARTITQAKPIQTTIAPQAVNVSPLPIIPPRIISQVLPIYPESAIQSGAVGVVVIEASIMSNGNLGSVKVSTTSGIADLDQAVITAVSQWKFSAATQGSSAVASVFKIPVRFQIKG